MVLVEPRSDALFEMGTGMNTQPPVEGRVFWSNSGNLPPRSTDIQTYASGTRSSIGGLPYWPGPMLLNNSVQIGTGVLFPAGYCHWLFK